MSTRSMDEKVEYEGRVHIEPDGEGSITGPTFRKNCTIRVRQMHEPFVVKTVRGWAEGEPGDYVAQSTSDPNDMWPLAKEIFDTTYEPDGG